MFSFYRQLQVSFFGLVIPSLRTKQRACVHIFSSTKHKYFSGKKNFYPRNKPDFNVGFQIFYPCFSFLPNSALLLTFPLRESSRKGFQRINVRQKNSHADFLVARRIMWAVRKSFLSFFLHKLIGKTVFHSRSLSISISMFLSVCLSII